MFVDVLHGIADEFRKTSQVMNLKPKVIECRLNKYVKHHFPMHARVANTLAVAAALFWCKFVCFHYFGWSEQVPKIKIVSNHDLCKKDDFVASI